MKKTELSSTIQRTMIVYLILMIGLISYIAYFQVFKAPDIAEKPGNVRLWAKRNEVLRGTIYDRNGLALTTSEKISPIAQKRTYTQGEYYANILGYVDQKYGISGLEKTLDKTLTEYNSITLARLLESLKIKDIFEKRTEKEQKIGNSVYTTFDTNLQKVAYNTLGNRNGAVVVLNPKTGEILSMVSKPSYNPNDLADVIQKANSGELKGFPLMNKATSGMYPPGSTFKVVTLASALENIPGVENKVFNDTGKIVFNSTSSLSNLNGVAFGEISLKKALEVSSNFVFGTLALDLGNEKLKATAEDFGFNKKVKSNGIAVETSEFPEISSSEPGSIAQSGIGQSSVLATPMQMALVAATIANNGDMMEPTVIEKTVDKNGNLVKKQDFKVMNPKVVTVEQSNIIKDYMNSLVKNRESRDWWMFKGLNAAGKTGTADYTVNGKDATPHAWFIGFAPADDPQIAISVIVESGGEGGKVAAPIAGHIMKAALGK